MALPQTIDQSTLNLSGKPAIATAPTTTTSVGATGMPNPTIAQEKSNVSPLLGALVGGALGMKYASQNAGSANQTANQAAKQQVASAIGNLIKGISSGTSTGGGSTGTVGGLTFPKGTSQSAIDAIYGTSNGQSNYVISGTNMSTGEVIAQPNLNIGGTNLTGTGAGPSDTLTPPTDQTAGTYFQDNYGNIYDPNGNLYAVNSGGQYYVNTGTDQWTDVNTGDVISTNDLYSSTGGGYDSSSDFTDITSGGGYADNSSFDNSAIDTGTYVKDGGYISGGLPTPLFKHGGNVKHFVGGGTTTDTTTNTTGNTTGDTLGGTPSILDSILGFAQSNPALTGAGIGALLTQLINSNTSYPVNKGVDMAALGALKPRTTPTGAARYVPYSEYGTPTTPYDYSSLYSNLGVSPFGSGAVSPSTPTSTAPTPSTGALSALTPSPAPTPTTTPTTTTPTAPQYYSDANGNIYDANGDLVYDTTSSSVVTPTTSSTVSSSLAVPSVASTPTVTSPTYSYGTPVNPSDILSSKKGGLAVKKMADGGVTGIGGMTGLAVNSLYDAIQKAVPLMEPTDINNLIATDPYRAQAIANAGSELGSPSTVSSSPELATFYNSMSSIDPSQYDNYFVPDATYNLQGLDITGQQIQDYFNAQNQPQDLSVTSTGDVPPIMYNQGMPEQRQDLMPTQSGLMPQQGSAMPEQTPFSTSPTFRYSGANNPLLTGLRQQVPGQQPFMLMPDGTFAPREEISTSRGYSLGGQPITDNLNVPVSTKPFSNVPSIQGRGDYRTGAYVEGEGDGQSDDIPAMLADGEYVIDAETVAQLGNGSNKAGAKVLDQFRKNIRAHKRGAPHDKIPPKSKSPLAYLKGAK
jgi:hypothetical protein